MGVSWSAVLYISRDEESRPDLGTLLVSTSLHRARVAPEAAAKLLLDTCPGQARVDHVAVARCCGKEATPGCLAAVAGRRRLRRGLRRDLLGGRHLAPRCLAPRVD